jgi:hypothetical protein
MYVCVKERGCVGVQFACTYVCEHVTCEHNFCAYYLYLAILSYCIIGVATKLIQLVDTQRMYMYDIVLILVMYSVGIWPNLLEVHM